MASIQACPHYEVAAADLASWLEQQGKDRWWNVDGDPLLTGRVSFPCPADELASEFRKIGRPLLVHAKKDDDEAKGQPINLAKFGEIVTRFNEDLLASGEKPGWANDRILIFRWKGSSHEWFLIEDNVTTDEMRKEVVTKAE